MRITSLMTAVAASAASLVLVAGPAVAGNAHFIQSATDASASGFDLRVDFKEAGLESGTVVTIEVSAHLDATYQCVNGGQKNPNATNKTAVSIDVAENEPFSVPKNGNLRGTIVLSAPAASEVLDCPNGQREQLSLVEWSDVVITDLTSEQQPSLALAGTFSAGQLVD